MYCSRKTIFKTGWMLAALLLGTFSAASASALPGVLEINQSCAEGPGCFPGDAPGLPVEITSPGNYALTSNLEVSGADTHGVYIRAFGSVTIDLRGFAVRGPIACTGLGDTLSCGSGTGHGVFVDLPVQIENPLRLFNGEITGFGGKGVWARRRARLHALRVHANGDLGIEAFSGSILTDCVVERNDGGGVDVTGAIVSGMTTRGNGGVGIDAQTSVIERSTSRDEDGWGMMGSFALFRDTTVSRAGFHGGFFSSSTLLAGTSFTDNEGAGIYLSGAHLRDATVQGNGGTGIVVQADSSYRSVTASDNGFNGDVNEISNATLFDLGENACSGALCP